MSLKELIDLIEEKSKWITPVLTAIVTWLLTRKKNKADTKKAMLDADETSIDVRIKEDAYQTQKYERLLKRLQESDKVIEELSTVIDQLSTQIQEMSQKLLKASQENTEIRAELALYKTIS